jgi:hypothetical protein
MMFLVWRMGLRGPMPSLDAFDPRASLEWKLHELSTIAIIPLDESERGLTLEQAVAAYPCPEIAD